MNKQSSDKSVKDLNKLNFFNRVMLILNIISAVITFISYFSVHVSPKDYWLAGFFTLSLPVMLIVVHPFFIIFWLISKHFQKIFISLLILISGFPLIQRTFTFHEVESVSSKKKSFEILSYNVQNFNQFNYYKNKSKTQTEKIYDFVSNHPADIKCLQDFFQIEKSSLFNSIEKIEKEGKYHYYMDPRVERLHTKKGFIGVAIFSKFPIVNKGEIFSSKHSRNKGIFADVVNGQDTVRIINIHLQSNKFKPDSLFDNSEYEEIKEKYKNVFEKLKYGFQVRGKQIEVLEDEIINSPYPVILCGDFNDTPYGFAYQRIRQYLNNSFEEKGSGFGFTYNGNIPFLRIDNQFFDKRFKIYEFKTDTRSKFSDHFPITARYILNKYE